jgi:hypothetical protein
VLRNRAILPRFRFRFRFRDPNFLPTVPVPAPVPVHSYLRAGGRRPEAGPQSADWRQFSGTFWTWKRKDSTQTSAPISSWSAPAIEDSGNRMLLGASDLREYLGRS